MNTDVYFRARARAFTGEGVQDHWFCLSPEGSIWVEDPVSGCYTTCHALNARQVARLKRLVHHRLAVYQTLPEWEGSCHE